MGAIKIFSTKNLTSSQEKKENGQVLLGVFDSYNSSNRFS
jgi:hypothetical protein